eukprot:TRINITY_DN16254_c0_g1_i1.p1 TRINITY_DN16254_c0_g1~~TRINITY_DN16254_c0_g1_i1.p1  ORF type:complete len:444 (+),score=123.10 TRINITY_DN16254_c0_g1_i1:40-1332(+)
MDEFKDLLKQLDVGVTCDLVQTVKADIIGDKGTERNAEAEAIFVDPKGLEERRRLRGTWGGVDPDLFEKARNIADPLLMVSHNEVPFRTRAALKLADIDQAGGFLSKAEPTDQLTFVDLCGAPGSWTEYLLWAVHTKGYLTPKPAEKALGWGFSLKTDNNLLDWGLDYLHVTAKKNLQNKKTFAVWGEKGDGDITNNDNLVDFMLTVKEQTEEEGVDVAMGDGGVICEVDYENMEGQLRRVVLCEVLAMMLVLKKGGNFVLKVLDVTSTFSICLLWVLYNEFEKVDLVKPTLSRPANSERYFIGISRRNPPSFSLPPPTPSFPKRPLSPTETVDLLYSVNTLEPAVNTFIDLATITSHKPFTEWLASRNDKHLTQQLTMIRAISAVIQSPDEEEIEGIRKVQADLAQKWWDHSKLEPHRRKHSAKRRKVN